ncbi:unnamed protein product [Durusdinium trenchii]|uniref:Uncharacterized protein n=1 Tax=Durusdinium trenchii TaxID=1381693 RepID=A0ABP0R8D6_9DINO
MGTLEELQAQVASLTERMDHMANKVALMHFTHDFCEKLEYESQLQMSRLKLNELGSTKTREPIATTQLLNGVVEILLQLREESPAAPSALGPARTYRPSLGTPSLRTAERSSPPSPPVSPSVGAAFVKGVEPLRTAEFGAGPPSPVHVPILVDHLQSTLECGGLALGRGTWANAYRSAPHGSRRRQALKMLCELGIVTEKELADDLTVISDEHIEECVSIGLTMLQRWPNHAPPPLEAKEFFQAQLEAMYRDKVPSPV